MRKGGVQLTKNELLEQRLNLWNQAQGYLDANRDSGKKVLDAEDAKTVDRIFDQIEALGAELERVDRAERIEARLNAPTSSPVLDGIGGVSASAEVESRKAFWDMLRTGRYTAGIENALKKSSDPDGGFLVPTEFNDSIVMGLTEENVMRKMATVVKTSNGDRAIPVMATDGKAQWLDEGAEFKELNNSYAQVKLGAYKLGAFVKVSEELMSDSAFDLEAHLTAALARAIGTAEEEGFLVGNGTGRPSGIFDPSSKAPTTVTSAKATDITLDECLDLMHSVRSAYRNHASWLMHDSTLKVLRKLKDQEGRYVWQPSCTVGGVDTLFNYPVYTSIYAPEVKAGATPLAFGDFSYYWIADRDTRSVRRLNELFALNGQVGIFGAERVDGRLVLPEAVALLKCKGA